MAHDLGCDRRGFLGADLAACGVGRVVAGSDQAGSTTPGSTPRSASTTESALGTLKQIAAGVLHVGYADAGPPDGRPVLLLHGWPYDIHSFVDVVPRLTSAGYRVIVPYPRGYGTPRFLSSDAMRRCRHRCRSLVRPRENALLRQVKSHAREEPCALSFSAVDSAAWPPSGTSSGC